MDPKRIAKIIALREPRSKPVDEFEELWNLEYPSFDKEYEEEDAI